MNLPVPIGMIHPPHSEREVTNRWDQNERTCQAQRESSYQNQNEHKVWTMREGVGDRRRKIAGVPQYRSLSAPLNNNQTIGIQAIHEYKTVVLPKCTQKGARAMYWRRLALQIPCSSRMQTSGRLTRGAAIPLHIGATRRHATSRSAWRRRRVDLHHSCISRFRPLQRAAQGRCVAARRRLKPFRRRDVFGFLEIHDCLFGDLPVELTIGCTDGPVAFHVFV